MEIDLTIGLSLLITVGGMIASIASAFAITKTKVAQIEAQFDDYKTYYRELESDIQNYNESEKVRIAVLENKQAILAEQVAEIKSDIKTTMTDVQEIKTIVLALRKESA